MPDPKQIALDCPHPDPCPSSECWGQFFLLKHYGIICTIRLLQLTGGDMGKVYELSKAAQLEHTEGLGGA